MNKIKVVLSSISPQLTTRLIYLHNFKKWPNLKNPKGINEKLQVLKLQTYYENDVITECVDKYRVRGYLESKGYGHLLPKLLDGAIFFSELTFIPTGGMMKLTPESVIDT